MKINKELAMARKEIDKINHQILNLLLDRLDLLGEISEIKKEYKLPIHDRRREKEMIKSLMARTKNKKKKAVIQAIFKALFKSNLSYLKQIQK